MGKKEENHQIGHSGRQRYSGAPVHIGQDHLVFVDAGHTGIAEGAISTEVPDQTFVFVSVGQSTADW